MLLVSSLGKERGCSMLCPIPTLFHNSHSQIPLPKTPTPFSSEKTKTETQQPPSSSSLKLNPPKSKIDLYHCHNMSSSLFCATSFSLTTNSSNKISALFPFPKKKQNPHLISSNGLSLSISHLNTKLSLKHRVRRPSRIIRFCYNQAEQSSSSSLRIPVGVGAETVNGNSSVEGMGSRLTVEVGNPNRLAFIPAARLSLGDQAFFLLSFIACTTSIAFTSLVIAAIPTLCAMARAATSLSKLADTAREELPSTMAAIRLSGMEISDLTLELSDLSHEIADGVNRSAQAVQVAEAGIRQMGTIARQQTMSMIQERANLPIISLQPAVAGAAKKTSHAVGRATKNLIYFISRGEFGSKSEDGVDRLEI